MLVYDRAAAPKDIRVELGEGVALTGAPLDARAHRRAFLAADSDLEALARGETAAHDWRLDAEELAAIGMDSAGAETAKAAIRFWMRAVLLALAFTRKVEGLADAGGAPVTAMDFDLAHWLLCDARFEAAFNLKIGETQRLRAAEGNG